MHMQQDAEECWGALLTAFRGQLKLSSDPKNTEQVPAIQELFGVSTRATLKCDESDETTEYSEVELMMKCNINAEVNHLAEGLKLGLRGDRERTSAALGRLAHFRGEALIEALPPYLTVQMVRFFYKADVQQKAKILRKVTFPLVLDMYEFCSDELKASLNGPRLARKEADDARAMAAKRPKLEAQNSADNAGDKAMPPPSGEEADDSNKRGRGVVTGRYDLIGILTHKGRSADSGHYVSWVKQTDGQWIQFDDDNMIPRKEEEVLALSGGGDWHMAYLLLYKAQLAEVGVSKLKENAEDVVADTAMADAEAK
jgi:ubiquitin carboxyl-terminal hydrolase 14